MIWLDHVFNFVTYLIMRAIIENMTLPDYALCCIPQVWEIFGNKSKILELFPEI